jgi:hypothetical protein
MNDLGPLHFLNISVEQPHNNLFLHQRQYTQDIIENAGMSNCKPCTAFLSFCWDFKAVVQHGC